MEDGVQETAEHTQRGGEYTNGALFGGVFLRNSGEGREKSLERRDKGGDSVAEDVGELVDRSVGGVNEISDGEAIRSGRGPGVELAQTFSNVRGVDGFKDFEALVRAMLRS